MNRTKFRLSDKTKLLETRTRIYSQTIDSFKAQKGDGNCNH